ncbi:alpha-D-ribose 1-methylphosphonate 5-triphosphate synthase subunit PhnG [Catenulispora sp. GP43]|uniref:CATRA conflict system CASPASE/TPR repeat-associated protein n=1 Tax=Catenulispora sp. GP43 TaxID=3156263 RepID=UPI003511A07C
MPPAAETARSAGLQIHAFLPADFVQRASSPERRYLDQLWEACGALGLTRGLDGGSAPDDIPESLPAAVDGFRLMAGRGAEGPDTLQAFVYRLHDVVGFSLMLSYVEPVPWRDLDELWSASAPVPGDDVDVLGFIRLYRAVSTSTARRSRGRHRTEDDLRQAFPDAGSSRLVWRGPQTLADATTAPSPVLVWEAAPESASRLAPERSLAVVAEPSAGVPDPEPAVDAWTWSATGAPELAPLGRALLHAAKIRYEARVLRADDRFRADRAEAEQHVDSLVQLMAAPATDVSTLLAVQRELGVLEAGATGLITARTRLRAMRRAVTIADQNLVDALGADDGDGGGRGGGHGAVLGRDRETARWVTRQIDADEDYLAATSERVREIAASVSSAVRERQDRRREQVTVLQGSFLGAVIMALTAVQALGYHVPVRASVQPALIAFLAATALVLPPAVLRWPRGLGGPAVFAWPDLLGVAVWAASGSWFVTAVWERGHGHRRSSVPTVLICVGTAIAVVAVVSAIRGWRRRRDPGSSWVIEADRPDGKGTRFANEHLVSTGVDQKYEVLGPDAS